MTQKKTKLSSGEKVESSKYGSVNDGFSDEESGQNLPTAVAGSTQRYRKNSDAF